jgi:putative endonuclease
VAKWQISLRETGLPAGRQARYTSDMFTVYVLSSAQRNYLYVGLSNNIDRRVEEHQKGKERTTRAYRPFELVYTEKFLTRQEARDKEKYLKSGSGKEWLKAYLSSVDRDL